jgi:hypothetical protein
MSNFNESKRKEERRRNSCPPNGCRIEMKKIKDLMKVAENGNKRYSQNNKRI